MRMEPTYPIRTILPSVAAVTPVPVSFCNDPPSSVAVPPVVLAVLAAAVMATSGMAVEPVSQLVLVSAVFEYKDEGLMEEFLITRAREARLSKKDLVNKLIAGIEKDFQGARDEAAKKALSDYSPSGNRLMVMSLYHASLGGPAWICKPITPAWGIVWSGSV